MTADTGRVIGTITVSADGYTAGHHQTEERPFGDDGGDGSGAVLHAWMFETPDENRAEIERFGEARAYIMGRNMFGPVRGGWDRPWDGWWGDEPPSAHRCSSSPTTPASRSRWPAARPSTSSPTASPPPWPAPAHRPGTGRSPSSAAPRP
ncbi:hypothetical protein ACFQ60_28000 [Streptomyces zhihengii]